MTQPKIDFEPEIDFTPEIDFEPEAAEVTDIPLADAQPAPTPVDPDREAAFITELGKEAAAAGLEKDDSVAAVTRRRSIGEAFAARESAFLENFPQHPYSLAKQGKVARAAEIKAQTVPAPRTGFYGAVDQAFESPAYFADRMGANAFPLLGAVGAARLMTVKGLQALPATATVGEKVVRGLTHAAPVAGMVAGGGLAGLAQEKVLSIGETPEETEQRHQRQATLSERPEAKLADLATMGIIARPSISGIERAVAGDAAAQMNIGAGAGLGGALATFNAGLEGRLPTSKELATGFTEGALFSTPTKLGARLMGHGPEAPRKTTAAEAKADIQKVMSGEAPAEKPMPMVSADTSIAASGLDKPLTREQAFVAATQGLDAVRTAPPERGTLEAGYREAGAPAQEKPPELMSPVEWAASGKKKGTQSQSLIPAIKAGKPVNAELWEQVLYGKPEVSDGAKTIYVKDGNVYRPIDLLKPPNEMVLEEFASYLDTLSKEAPGGVGSHIALFFDPTGRQLEAQFATPEKYAEAEALFAPAKKALQERFGNSVPLYRAESKGDSPRNIFSYSLSRKIAERHARDTDRPITEEMVPLDAVVWADNKGGEMELLVDRRRVREAKPSLEQIRTEGTQAPDPNRQQGPGAANIEEFGPQRTISARNAEVDAQRVARGLQPLMSRDRKADTVTWDNAERRIEADPEYPDKLVAEIESGRKTSISDEEQAALVWQRNDLRTRATMEYERLADETLTPEERAEAEANANLIESKLARNEVANRKIGSESGAALRQRRVDINEDFTVAAMTGRARTAKGEALTPEERTAIAEESKKIEAASPEKLDEAASVGEAQKVINKESRYHPRVLEYAEGIVSRWETEAVKAKADLMSLMGITSANPFQTKAITALYKMARAKIARGALSSADFALEMVQSFGEKVRPYIEPAWQKAEKFITGMDATRRPKSKKQVEKEQAGAREAESTEAGITSAAQEGSTLDALRPYVKRLAKDYIKAGEKTVEGLQTKLHDFFSKILPDVTPRELRDIFSDYGTGKPAPTDPLRIAAAQIRGESQKLSALEDLTRQLAGEMEKTGVPPSGDKRVPQSDRARSLTKKINELKKELGIVEGDPAKRLATALEGLETRTTNRIRDLKFEIAKGERTVRQRGEQPTSPKLEALRAELAEVQAEHETVFGKREVTPEQKLKAAIAAAERAEKQAVQDVQNARKGIFRKRPAPGKANAELEALRARTKAARATVNELKALDPAQRTKAEQQAINQRKTQLAKRAADYADRVAKGDFEPRTRKERDLSKDPEAVRLKAEADKAKADFEKRKFEWEQAKRSRTRKVIDTAKDVLGSTRTLITSGDVSAPFRQGGFLLLGDLAFNPVRAGRQIGKMFHVMASEKGFNEAEAALRMRPNAELYEHFDLHLSDPHGRFTQREENMRSNLAEQIPLAGRVVKGSNRAYAGFLNRQRADAFDAFVDMMGGKDRITPDEGKFLAKAVNDLTGRSDLSSGKAIGVADWLARYLFSPRFLLSRFKTLVGAPIFRDIGNSNISLKARGVVALQYAKFAAGLAALYGLAKLSGAEVELDPRSSDFGKAKFGNTRIDAMAGLQQVAVFLSRMFTGKTKTAKGDIKSIRVSDENTPKFGDRTAVDVAATFGRSKLAPLPAAGVDWLQGMTMDFERPSLLNTTTKLVVPIGYQDAPAVMREHGAAKGAVIEALNLLGMGVQHYEPRKK